MLIVDFHGNWQQSTRTCTAVRTSPGLSGCRAAGLSPLIFVMYTGPLTPWHPKPMPNEPAVSNVHWMSRERSFRSAFGELSVGCGSLLPAALLARPADMPSSWEGTRTAASALASLAFDASISRSRHSASSSSWTQYLLRAWTPRHRDWTVTAPRCRTEI